MKYNGQFLLHENEHNIIVDLKHITDKYRKLLYRLITDMRQ
jgi:hypothetical protein